MAITQEDLAKHYQYRWPRGRDGVSPMGEPTLANLDACAMVETRGRDYASLNRTHPLRALTGAVAVVVDGGRVSWIQEEEWDAIEASALARRWVVSLSVDAMAGDGARQARGWESTADPKHIAYLLGDGVDVEYGVPWHDTSAEHGYLHAETGCQEDPCSDDPLTVAIADHPCPGDGHCDEHWRELVADDDNNLGEHDPATLADECADRDHACRCDDDYVLWDVLSFHGELSGEDLRELMLQVCATDSIVGTMGALSADGLMPAVAVEFDDRLAISSLYLTPLATTDEAGALESASRQLTIDGEPVDAPAAIGWTINDDTGMPSHMILELRALLDY